jgi:hypothetical protein
LSLVWWEAAVAITSNFGAAKLGAIFIRRFNSLRFPSL